MKCGGSHQESLTAREQEAFNRGFNAILEALKLPDGTLPGWSSVRVSGVLHSMFLGAFSYHSDCCTECDEALEVIEGKYLKKAFDIECEKSRAAGRTLN